MCVFIDDCVVIEGKLSTWEKNTSFCYPVVLLPVTVFRCNRVVRCLCVFIACVTVIQGEELCTWEKNTSIYATSESDLS